jgi:hypothetical protein
VSVLSVGFEQAPNGLAANSEANVRQGLELTEVGLGYRFATHRIGRPSILKPKPAAKRNDHHERVDER